MGKINMAELYDEQANDVVVVEYNGRNIEVKPLLSLDEMMSLVNCVVNSCFDEDGKYIPEARDYVTRYTILRIYTNIELSRDDDESYRFVYDCDDLISDIMSVVDESQFRAIDRAISDKIVSLVDFHANEANARVEKLYGILSNTVEQFTDIFGDITEEDIQKAINAISESGIDTDKFVETYMKQKYE